MALHPPSSSIHPPPEEAFARALDEADPLAGFRGEFILPGGPGGEQTIYLLGNSLGPMPRGVPDAVDEVLVEWSRSGVEAWTAGSPSWMQLQDLFRDDMAAVVGAEPSEVVTMNSLTVNLHLMLASFYQPEGRKTRVLMEHRPFPSDRYAVASHLAMRGVDPAHGILEAPLGDGESAHRTEDLEALIAEHRDELALVLLGGVNYYTGQWFDIPRLARAAHAAGCRFGVDLAHAAGNVPLALHDWDVDFAVWCTYKYLNGGPGAPGAAFVHARHSRDRALPRLAGWWGHEAETRFDMGPDFSAEMGADGWQISTPPVLGLAPLRASLAMFARAGMPAIRAKSESLTGYLYALLHGIPARRMEILTPSEADARGCQLSLYVPGAGRALHASLQSSGIITDYREPDVVRLAPAPLFNSYYEVWCTARAIRQAIAP